MKYRRDDILYNGYGEACIHTREDYGIGQDDANFSGDGFGDGFLAASEMARANKLIKVFILTRAIARAVMRRRRDEEELYPLEYGDGDIDGDGSGGGIGGGANIADDGDGYGGGGFDELMYGPGNGAGLQVPYDLYFDDQ